ncbi:MAG: DNA cytosine methyltransferase [Acidobacteriia bacterium]|nr:DNA cytosine methyltransferase [Terriglobia bacterium]
MNSVELFAGCGGLALGLHRGGFSHVAVIDWDEHACGTLARNKAERRAGVDQWTVIRADVRQFDFHTIAPRIDLVAGGVPCQPFSIGGKHRGYDDDRNLFPEMLRGVRELQPKAVLIENVRGLKRPAFLQYFSYLELALAYPELRPREGENWADHRARLERYHTRGKPDGLHYQVVHAVLNAADYGVPQKRERVFIVAIRSDLGAEFAFPPVTHSEQGLLWSQYATQEYWERHAIAVRRRPTPSAAVRSKVDQIGQDLRRCLQPWQTVRDQLCDLPPPARLRSEMEPGLTHFLVPGARSYAGHTGSKWDEPAKTLKAGDHGVPGGENMLADDCGVRYFTIRESARLQTFPDEYVFPGSWTESMRQIGNAVPVLLAEMIGTKLHTTLRGHPGDK